MTSILLIEKLAVRMTPYRDRLGILFQAARVEVAASRLGRTERLSSWPNSFNRLATIRLKFWWLVDQRRVVRVKQLKALRQWQTPSTTFWFGSTSTPKSLNQRSDESYTGEEDDDLPSFESMRKGSGSGTPGDNQRQNKSFADAVRGKGLSRDQERRVHDEITGKDYDFGEIEEVARDISSGG